MQEQADEGSLRGGSEQIWRRSSWTWREAFEAIAELRKLTVERRKAEREGWRNSHESGVVVDLRTVSEERELSKAKLDLQGVRNRRTQVSSGLF